MDTGAIRPIGTIPHDPLPRRDDVAGSIATTDLPTTKTVRAPQAASDSHGADDRRNPQQATPNVKIGFERDASSGSIVYRWVDQTTEKVILQIPRADKILTRHLYEESTAPKATSQAVDRSV